MDLSYGAAAESFREGVRRFLKENWRQAPDRVEVSAFREKATNAGYLYRNVPRRFGGSEQTADLVKAQIIREEFAKARAPMEVPGNGINMLVPTLLDRGEEWQKEMFIPKTMSGQYQWAQGYSEPGSGSDLASVRTKGELVGDEWVINGQKVWTSNAQNCQFMFALIRTEHEAAKHEGITYMLIDLRQPGVEIRPLKQITGGEEFNEVFLTDVRTPADWIVGQRGEGWSVSRTTLKHERSAIGGAAGYEATFSKLVTLAKETVRDGGPAIDDPEIRKRLCAIEARVLSHKYSSFRQFSMTAAGKNPGPVALMNKLVSTNLGHEIACLAQELIADDGLILPAKRGAGIEVGHEKWINQYFGSLGVAIAGGTSNIQRNIIAERGLGLPRDRSGGGGQE